MVGLHPLDQRAAGMQRDVEIGKFFEDLQERQVAVLVGLLEYAVKVTHRLVVVQNEAESDFVLAHGKIGGEVRRNVCGSQTVFIDKKPVVCLTNRQAKYR